MEEKFYVYFHINPLYNKIFYVGKGCGNRAYSRNKRNKHWNNIVKKYGFVVDIIEKNLSEEKSFEVEKYYINKLGLNNLCNITNGGIGGVCGIKMSEETKKKISDKLKGIPKPKNVVDNLKKINIGKKHSDKTKEKLKKLNLGKVLSEETKLKIGQSSKGNKHNVGRKHSKETIEKRILTRKLNKLKNLQ